MIGFVCDDEVEAGLSQAQCGQSGLQAREGLELSGRRGLESRENHRGGETGRVLARLQTLDTAQLASGLKELGEQSESLQVMVDSCESHTAREDLVKVSRQVVGQAESLNIL